MESQTNAAKAEKKLKKRKRAALEALSTTEVTDEKPKEEVATAAPCSPAPGVETVPPFFPQRKDRGRLMSAEEPGCRITVTGDFSAIALRMIQEAFSGVEKMLDLVQFSTAMVRFSSESAMQAAIDQGLVDRPSAKYPGYRLYCRCPMPKDGVLNFAQATVFLSPFVSSMSCTPLLMSAWRRAKFALWSTIVEVSFGTSGEAAETVKAGPVQAFGISLTPAAGPTIPP